jgi:hydrocephalus-inducing protein
MGIMI